MGYLLLTGYGQGYGEGYDIEELPFVSFGGRRLIILKQPKVEAVRVFTALRIKSDLKTVNISKIYINSRLGKKLTTPLRVKSTLKTATKSQIIIKSSLKTKIYNSFMIKGVQSYNKFFNLIKIIELAE